MRKKTEERRQAILDAAEQIFQQVGFDRASMAQICSEVGFSKATLYSYFSSKEELFFEVMMSAANSQFDATVALLDLPADDARKALCAYGERFLGFLYSPRVQAIRRLIATEGPRSELGRKCYERGPAQGEAKLAEFLQRLIDRGELKAADAKLMGLQLRSLLEAEWYDRFMFGEKEHLSDSEIHLSVARAVEVFIAAYGR